MVNTQKKSGGLLRGHVCTMLEFLLRFSYGARVALSSLVFWRPLMRMSQELKVVGRNPFSFV